MTKFVHFYSEKFASKWLIFFIDLLICTFAFGFATVLRFNFSFTYYVPPLFKYHLMLILVIKATAFIYYKSYQGIIRHTSLEDAILIFKATGIAAIELVVLNGLVKAFSTTPPAESFFSISLSLIAIDFFISLFALVFSRLLIKGVYEQLLNGFKSRKLVIIYGAGHLGRITKDTLKRDKKHHYEILCFIDDNITAYHKSIEGINVISRREALKRYFQSEQYKDEEIEVIFAIQSIPSSQKRQLIDELISHNIDVKVVPPVRQWINGELSPQQIKKIKIEDLLEREPIAINNQFVADGIANKVIMVTGAAGSIGSEIVRQLIKFKPNKIVLVDQSESGLYDLETELYRVGQGEAAKFIETETCNVVNSYKVREIFETYKPQIVYHAAAYKHVPLMEKNPFKAFEVNVLATKQLSDLASEYRVEKFVMISTDKAVNPTNVMGASKRLAEMYVHGLNGHFTNRTRFIITRFGNVLGSNGSVIPLFKRQIEAGGPLTITHPDIIRYFMTIPEACQLVLEAGTMGKGGEVFVFDMGEPVKILDLAKRMINLSGLTYGKDIDITFTGLRPGEKLFEELLLKEESVLPTYHPKIMIARVSSPDFQFLKADLQEQAALLAQLSKVEIVTILKRLVPEFISQNSAYSELDASALPSKREENIASKPEESATKLTDKVA